MSQETESTAVGPRWKAWLRDRTPAFWASTALGVVLLVAVARSPSNGMTILLIIGGFVLYFLPSIIGRDKHNSNTIFVINLFLGWSLVGWVVALAMAVNKQAPAPVPAVTSSGPTRSCPFCAEQILVAAVVCKHCGRDVPTV